MKTHESHAPFLTRKPLCGGFWDDLRGAWKPVC